LVWYCFFLRIELLCQCMAKDLTEVYKKYKGKWVVLTSGEEKVMAAGSSVDTVVSEARAKGVKKPVLLKVPTKIIPYIGGF